MFLALFFYMKSTASIYKMAVALLPPVTHEWLQIATIIQKNVPLSERLVWSMEASSEMVVAGSPLPAGGGGTIPKLNLHKYGQDGCFIIRT